MDRIPFHVLGQCIKAVRQVGIDRGQTFLRALLEFYQDMPLQTPINDSNDIESYRTLDEVRRYSNKELEVNRELIERAIDPKYLQPWAN